MRKRDIDELLIDVSENLKLLDERQQEAIEDKNIRELLRVKVKSCTDNLKSILDYAAQDIYQIVLQRPRLRRRVKVYFPYGLNSEVINERIREVFPRLSVINPSIYTLVKSIQTPSRKGWLYVLCSTRNTNSHSRLANQRREDVTGYSLLNNGIYIGGECKHVHIQNVSYTDENGNLKTIDYMPIEVIDGSINLTENELAEVDGKRSNMIEFVFDENNLPVLALLNEAYNEIREFINRLYELIEKSKSEC